MPLNFDTLKSTLFGTVSGKPSWNLADADNPYNRLVDQVAMLDRTVNPADETVIAPVALTVEPSPFIHICGTAPEQIYIYGGVVSAVERWSEETDEWIAITLALPVSCPLPPAGQLRVTYSAAPTMVKDAGNFNNASGLVEVLTPAASPWTIVADGGRAIMLHISGGAINSIKRAGVVVTNQVPAFVPLPKGGSVVIDYNTAPRVVKDS